MNPLEAAALSEIHCFDPSWKEGTLSLSQDCVKQFFLAGAAYERERAKDEIESLKTDLEIAAKALKTLGDACDGEIGCWCGEVIRGEEVEICPRCFAEETLSNLKSKLGWGGQVIGKKMNFASAIAYMTANPGKEVESPQGFFYYFYDDKFVYYSETKELATRAVFGQDDVSGQWTLPEPELPEVEVVGFSDDTGHIRLARRGSSEEAYLKDIGSYTKCKIKFNQGEE